MKRLFLLCLWASLSIATESILGDEIESKPDSVEGTEDLKYVLCNSTLRHEEGRTNGVPGLSALTPTQPVLTIPSFVARQEWSASMGNAHSKHWKMQASQSSGNLLEETGKSLRSQLEGRAAGGR